MKRYSDYGEDEVLVEFPLPDDWDVTTTNLGWEAHAQSADKEIGVSATGRSKAEALRNLKHRMDGWLDILVR